MSSSSASDADIYPVIYSADEPSICSGCRRFIIPFHKKTRCYPAKSGKHSKRRNIRVSKFDTFSSDKTVTATYKDGETATVKVTNPRKAIEIQGELTPGDSVDLKISLDNLKLKFSELDKIKSAEVNVINNSTKEVEKLKFDRNGTILTSSANTVKSEKKTNMDVLLLILLFGVTMYISQKVMMKSQSAPMDEAQAAMQKSLGKIMPIMVTGMFVFIPIPAGVMLYLVTSNIIQLLQTMVINKQLEKEMPQTPSNGVIDAEVVDKK